MVVVEDKNKMDRSGVAMLLSSQAVPRSKQFGSKALPRCEPGLLLGFGECHAVAGV